MSSQVPPPQNPDDRSSGSGEGWGDNAWSAPPAQPDQAGAWGDDRMQGPRAASVGKRVGAFIIDWIGLAIVTAVIAIPVGVASALTGGDMMGMGFGYGFNLFWSVIVLAYFVLLEANGGQTLAKMMLGIRAVRADGGPLDLTVAFKRNFWWVVGNFVPWIGGLVSLGIYIYALVTTSQDQPLHRGFHDQFAGSMVVETR